MARVNRMTQAIPPARPSVTLLIPALNEAKILPQCFAHIAALDPPPAEIIFVDGESTDKSVTLAKDAGCKIVKAQRGRAVQINTGVAHCKGDYICILHADSILPADAISVITGTLSGNQDIALASFMPRIMGAKKTCWGTTIHNILKTWYAPALLKPHLFLRGVRLLFGDHSMFFRRRDFLAIGGIPDNATIMEEADLCIGMAQKGKIKMVRRWAFTSDRRIAQWGALKANYLYLKIGIMWCFGVRKRLVRYYPDIR